MFDELTTSSAIVCAAFVDITIFPESTSFTAFEYSDMPSPNAFRFSLKFDRLFSPVKNPFTLSVSGNISTSSAIVCAAFAEAVIFPESTSFTAFEYSDMPLPNAFRFPLKFDRLFSPVKNSLMPPVFGNIFTSSTIVCAAFAEAVIFPESTSFTAFEYSDMPLPNAFRFSPKFERLFFPVKNSLMPPVSGREFTISNNAFAAFAVAVTASGFTSATSSAYFFI